MSEHYGQVVGLRPERREEYLRLHRPVWVEVERTIRGCGTRDDRIYLHGDLLFLDVRVPRHRLRHRMARMAADPVTRRWWDLTGRRRIALDPSGTPWSKAGHPGSPRR
ncbi:L-rhamnose mutarotase [Pseudolysinimonas sp.]|uniref:L-rhamnose mutarotase n=1 Tax=Pseudolysinimonas sp. TaxID=2680009 RepID=UPI003F81E7F1